MSAITPFTMTDAPADRATDKQIAFLSTLIREHADLASRGGGELDDEFVDSLIGMAKLNTRAQCSAVIDHYKTANAALRAQYRHAAEIDEGIYSSSIGLVRVTRSKTSGRPYASTWSGSKWEYGPGLYAAMRGGIVPSLASVEELAAAGVESGICLVCSRTLTNPESIERGIGPICASKL